MRRSAALREFGSSDFLDRPMVDVAANAVRLLFDVAQRGAFTPPAPRGGASAIRAGCALRGAMIRTCIDRPGPALARRLRRDLPRDANLFYYAHA